MEVVELLEVLDLDRAAAAVGFVSVCVLLVFFFDGGGKGFVDCFAGFAGAGGGRAAGFSFDIAWIGGCLPFVLCCQLTR